MASGSAGGSHTAGGRALEEAKARLDPLRDRNALLDVFFDHATKIFGFCVLFVVKDNVAHGRNVHGLGAPSGLVARLAFPLSEPGVLAQANEVRRTILVSPAADGADASLLGSLGRAMPAAVLAPVVVRGRVVAILLGESSLLKEDAGQRAVAPLELARSAIGPWSEAVGEAFERLIIARKAEEGAGSAAAVSLRRPVLARDSQQAPFVARSPRRDRNPWVIAAAVGAVLVLAAGGAFWVQRTQTQKGVVFAGTDLPGWPAALDPTAAVVHARRASGLGDAGELLAIRAEMTKGGTVDVSARPGSATSPATQIAFATPETEVQMKVDAAGMRVDREQPRTMCEGRPCQKSVAAPRSTFAQLWEAAVGLGALDGDRVSVTYGEDTSGPEWSLSIDGRGFVRLADGTNKPLTRDRFRPPAVPIASIPGAPHDVDPLAVLSLARAQSGFGPAAAILEIDARGVGANGLVDLGEVNRSVTYRLSEAASVPTSERRWRQVKLTAEGMPITSIATDDDDLPTLVRGPVDLPRCSFAEAWARGGLPADSTARVIYRAEGAFPEAGEWTLDAPSLGTQLSFTDRQCAVAVGKIKG